MLFRLLLVAALSAFALIPLTPAHFFASSDGLYHIYRAMEVYRCLQSGVLICRWMPDQFLGYGTPLLNLYSPAVYYVIAAFHALGLGWVNATKASMAVFMVFSGLAAYGYATDFLSRRAALLVAVVYVYVPYHLVNAYYRGDLPEFFAMAWFPAILWAFGRLVRPGPIRRRLPYFAAAALCYAGLILTHNLSAYIYTGVLVLYCAFLLLRGLVEESGTPRHALRAAALLLGATILAYGLTAYLSLPAIFEKHLVQLDGLLYVSHADHFPTLQQIMPNHLIHTYGIIFPESPEYAYKMGLVQVVLGGLGAVVALLFYRGFPFRARGEAAISVFVFAVAFWFARPESLWAWDWVPLLPYAQFPWRFLLLMALPTSVLTGFLVDLFAERWRAYVAPLLIVFTLLTNTLGLRPIMANAVDGDVDLAESTRFELMYHLLGTTVAGEYIPIWVEEKPFISPEALAIVLGRPSPAVHVPTSDPRVTVERLDKGSDEQTYRADSPVEGRIVLNTAYFPGWRATIDGAPTDIEITDPEGLIALRVPPGQHLVGLQFEDTPIRTLGERISLFSLVMLLAVLTLAWVRPPARIRRSVGAHGVRPAPALGVRAPAMHPYAAARLHLNRQSLARTGLIVAIMLLLPFGVAFYSRAYQPPPLAQHPLKINLGDTLMLLGYDLRVGGQLLGRTDSVPAGTRLELATYWRGIGPDAERIARTQPYARLSNIDEQNWAFVTESGRASLDADGHTFRSDTAIDVPSGLPPGVYQIDLGAFTREGRPLPVRNMELVELLPTQGSIRVGPIQVRAGGGPIAQLSVASSANYENRVRLESFDLQVGLSDRRSAPLPILVDAAAGLARTRAGETLQLDLLWRSPRAHPGRFTVSASLEDEQGFKWAVRDSEPADRMYPTWMWSADETVRDQLRMPIPAETPPGRYRLQLKLVEGERPLSLLDGGGSPIGATARLIDVELARSEIQARERDVQIAERRRRKVTDDLELIGEDVGRTELGAGESLDVVLVWRATRDVRRDYTARLGLVGPDGNPWGDVTAAPAGAANPTSRWERGDVFRGQYRLRLNRSAEAGAARLVVELLEPGADKPAGRVELGQLTVKPREGRAAADAATTPVDLLFGERARLVAFGVQPGLQLPAGRPSELELALLWQAERPMDLPYTVFTQLLTPEGKLVAQHDGPPDDGQRPTTGWQPGERVPDSHRIPVPSDLPPGQYALIVGLYDPRDGARLAMGPDRNYAELATVTLAP
ncbi:MAG: hypothetical protein H0V51_09290 [Chloroflexi bacterium]|nr:hypothetical protein [Chloroflexota bacterium]